MAPSLHQSRWGKQGHGRDGPSVVSPSETAPQWTHFGGPHYKKVIVWNKDDRTRRQPGLEEKTSEE